MQVRLGGRGTGSALPYWQLVPDGISWGLIGVLLAQYGSPESVRKSVSKNTGTPVTLALQNPRLQ